MSFGDRKRLLKIPKSLSPSSGGEFSEDQEKKSTGLQSVKARGWSPPQYHWDAWTLQLFVVTMSCPAAAALLFLETQHRQ